MSVAVAVVAAFSLLQISPLPGGAQTDGRTGGRHHGSLVAPSVRGLTDEIFYFVLPDRFENGDTRNDTGRIRGGPLEHGFDPTHRGFFHGGDLAGLNARLDYLEGLGVTSLWMGPVFKNRPVQGLGTEFVSAGYHGYWTEDFTRVDPHFGSNADLRRLRDAVHDRDMKLFFDIITNHTADVIDYEEKVYDYVPKDVEPYRDANGEPFDDRDYAGSWRFPRLDPEVSFPYTPFFNTRADAIVKRPFWLNSRIYYHNRGNTTFSGENSVYGDFFGLDDLFTEHPRVVRGMIDIFQDWVDFGVDGFRVDTTKHVNIEFWQDWAPAMLAEARRNGNDDFFMFGEVFDPNPNFPSIFSTTGLLPAVLDFGFQNRAQAFAANSAPTENLQTFFAADDWYLDVNSNAYSLPTFLGNHDMGRIGMFVSNANPGASDDELLARDLLAHSLMYFARGMPVIYSGDEQGFTGAGGDQLARQDLFPSLTEEYWDDDQIGTDETPQEDNFDTDHPIYATLAALGGVIEEHPALRSGAQIHQYASDAAGIYAFSRVDRDERVEYLVAANNSESEQTATFDALTPDATFEPVWPAGGTAATSGPAGEITVTVPPLTIALWRADGEVPPSPGAPAIAFEDPEPFFLSKDGHERQGLWLEATLDRDLYAEVSFAMSVDGGPFRRLGTDDNAPYQIFASTQGLGVGTPVAFKAIVNDLNGHFASAEVASEVPEPLPPDDPAADEPLSVTIAGSLQSELGCPGDWQPECLTTALTWDRNGDVWSATFDVPAGSWEYKAALNGTWTENYGAGAVRDGPNIPLNLTDPTSVTFWYKTDTHFVTDDVNTEIVTAPGSYQSEIGCTSDWDPACMGSWLQDPDDDGTYTFSTSRIPAGIYEVKVAHDRAWDENYGQGGVPNGANIPFDVADGQTVLFSYDIATHVLTVSTT
ncbi:MAG: alpha-amylase family glycosyl hydrolase [Actinomycetota bacterium]